MFCDELNGHIVVQQTVSKPYCIFCFGLSLDFCSHFFHCLAHFSHSFLIFLKVSASGGQRWIMHLVWIFAVQVKHQLAQRSLVLHGTIYI